jgi:hypothetical protein
MVALTSTAQVILEAAGREERPAGIRRHVMRKLRARLLRIPRGVVFLFGRQVLW